VKFKQFNADLKEAARHYGYSAQDVDAMADHRLLLLAKDAMAYRRLMANRPKVQAKVKDAPPVQKPGRRPDPAANQSRVDREKWDKLRKSGSLEAGADVLLQLTKGT
jgi:hypothetical protein